MYCHNIPREYNLAIGQRKKRPLPRKCPLWAAHLSEAHGWTLTGADGGLGSSLVSWPSQAWTVTAYYHVCQDMGEIQFSN